MTGELPRVTGPAGVRWLDSFDAWAAREPGRVAIHPAGAAAITYGELAALAGRIASGIVAVTPESSPRVGVLSEDAAILAAGLLGALKASAVFVPLDPAHPRARLVSIVADTGPALMLADARNHRLGEWLAGADIPLLPFPPRPSATPAKDLPPAAGPDALAWILYTSSTSGRPKGVMQTRANVGTYATQVIDGLSLVSADRMLLASPLHVHAGATLSLAALRSGATLVPVDLRERGIERMATLIAAQAITLMFAVPTIFRALARWISTARVAPAVDFSGVRLLRLSGETVSGADLDDAWRIFPGLETVSVGLGTTETGGISHAYFHRGAAPLGRIPVGLPVDGVRVTLADGRGKPVPDGDTGEIVVTSATLSPGYWRDPALTAARFKAEPGARQYRTGDLGRRLPDGTLEHLGRKGFQVKINGQRVELAEIEAALRGLPGVADSAVRVVGRDERRTLAAYVVAQPGVVLLDAELRASLSAQLPRHMIPASYARLAALPVTRSGKVKARALRPPRADDRPGVGGRAVSGLEAAICAIWDEVLALERAVGCDDDFIAVGGDSLQAVQILARVEAACGSRPSLSAFFDAATPARLAALIAKGG